LPVWLSLVPALSVGGVAFFVGYFVGMDAAMLQAHLSSGHDKFNDSTYQQRIRTIKAFVTAVAAITPLIPLFGLPPEMILPGILVLVGCAVGDARKRL